MLMTLDNYIRNSNLPMGYQSKHIEIRENLNMKHYALSLTSLLLISLAVHLPAANGAEINPKVTAALAWEVPENECGQPRCRRKSHRWEFRFMEAWDT